METLSTLNEFTEKYPQYEKGKLQYAFTGGTGIRLSQEKIDYPSKRIISDFDLLVFENGKYPVHTFDMRRRLVPLEKEELQKYVADVNIKGKDYFFMEGAFLALSKTCAIDTPREKDYKDIKFLYDSGQIEMSNLEKLFAKSEFLSHNSKLSMKIFNSVLSKTSEKNVHLFQTFRHYVNLVDNFDSKKKAKKIIKKYIKEDINKSGYALSTVMYNTGLLFHELDGLEEDQKLGILSRVLNFASGNDHIDFDRKVHNEFLPKLKYSKSGKDKFNFI